MRRSHVVVAGLVALVGLGVGLHFAFPPSYVGICANTKTHIRVADGNCQPIRDVDDGWIYYDTGATIPAVGQQADDGSVSAPDGDQVKLGGVPAQGQLENNGDNGNFTGRVGGLGGDDGE
jgi:hypothetical protein